MKRSVLMTIASWLLPLGLWSAPADYDIDAQIAAIQSAPPEKRVEMMNAFKRRLFRMNRAQRMEAIERLRRNMGAGHGHPPAAHVAAAPMRRRPTGHGSGALSPHADSPGMGPPPGSGGGGHAGHGGGPPPNHGAPKGGPYRH
ncbi:hypothetical protein [Hydrogenimonas sp.]